MISIIDHIDDFRIPFAHSGIGAWHSHDTWQIEIMLRGCCQVHIQHRVEALSAGEVLAIAPGVDHAFSYSGRPSAWLSAKIRTDAGPDSRGSPLSRSSAAEVRKLAQVFLHSLSGPKPLQTHLAVALLWTVFPVASDVGPGLSRLIDQALACIRSTGGRPISPEAIAKTCAVTPNHLANTLRRAGLGSTKRCIDRYRGERAVELLVHSDMTIATIADYLGFNDIFSFSRFVRRLSGQPPTWHRQHGGGRTRDGR